MTSTIDTTGRVQNFDGEKKKRKSDKDVHSETVQKRS